MIIQHNITALNAYNRLSNNNSVVSKNLEKLSSGYRINRAGDDAAGLAISEKMRAQITGLERASLNAQDGISLVQTAEGALTEVHSMLNRMVELGTQSANGTFQAEDRQKIQSEVDALLGEIDRISQATNFNGINLLDGSLGLDTAAITSKTTGAITANGFTSVGNVQTSGAAVTAAAGKFEIDFNDLAVEAGTNGTLTISVGGQDINITLDSSKAAAANVTTGGNYLLGTKGAAVTAAQLLTAASAIITDKFTVTGPPPSFEMGGDVVKTLTTNGTALVIEQNAAPTSDAKVIDLAKTGFSVTSNVTAGKVTGDIYHGVKVINKSVSSAAAKLAHADISFDVSKLGNGSTLTIGDKTFTFYTKDSGKTAPLGATTDIDLLAYTEADLAEMDKDELKTLVADKVSVAAAANATTEWNVTKTQDGKGIHIDQKVAATDFSKASLITSQIKSSSIAKNATAQVTLDDSKIRNGTAVKIGDTLYEFTNDKNNLKNAGATAVLISHMTNEAGSLSTGDAASALAKAAGGTVSLNDSQTAIIKAKTATADAPSVGGAGLTLQIGDTADSFNQVTVAVDDMSSKGLGIDGLKVTDQGWSQDSIDKIRGAIEKVSVNRGNLGALQNRLEHTINNLTTTSENMTAAESRVRDTDMAKEMMDFTKNNVLVQAAQAMLAQANQQPQQVLQLLR